MDVVGHLVKFNAQTNGRDKLCRLFQYSSKFALWSLETYRPGGSQDLQTKLKNLESTLSATRKVLRIGKSADMFQGAVKSLSVQDFLHKLCLVIAKTSQGAYLLLDNYIWFGKQGLINVDTKKYGPRAAAFWLVTLFFSLIRNVYDILNILENESRRRKRGEVGGNWMDCAGRHKPIIVDTVKNITDLFLPLSILQYINTSTGFQGLMGMISSIMGILVTWDPAKYKLSPA
jgi:peroxin-11B